MTKLLSAEPELLRSDVALSDDQVGVDRQKGVIKGYVVAQQGRFKTKGRGQFTLDSLQKLVTLGNAAPNGVRSRFGHPNQSDDALGKYLGRAKNFRLDGEKVCADMHLNPTALQEPPQGGRALGAYVMHLAETDPGALSSSIVVLADKEPIEGQPPVWHPTHLYASDVVDTGDAVDGFLSVDFLEDLPSGSVFQATKLIEKQFSGQPRDIVQARLRAFVDKCLDHQFGPADTLVKEDDMSQESDARIEKLEERIAKSQEQLASVTGALGKLTEQLAADRDEAKKREASEQRARRITALCAQCGVDARQANEWIADESLSVDSVKDQLLARKFADAKPAGDGGGSENLSKDEKYAREYELHKKDHRALGITRDDYVKLRKEEEDGDAMDYMSPEWADKYREKMLVR